MRQNSCPKNRGDLCKNRADYCKNLDDDYKNRSDYCKKSRRWLEIVATIAKIVAMFGNRGNHCTIMAIIARIAAMFGNRGDHYIISTYDIAFPWRSGNETSLECDGK